ncbi:hypothetical protein MMC12_003452 [Toensbergia leucococca]|nr:hypothetical protein [Toensbergia leucococca]
MYLTQLGALALSVYLANAFQNTSPLFFFSTSEILASSPQIASAASLSETLTKSLERCPSDTYVIVSQPGVNAVDYRNRHAAPYLKSRITGTNRDIRSSFTVTDVVGEIDPNQLVSVLETQCGAGILSVDASTGSFPVVDDMKPRIISLDFPSLSTTHDRASKLSENDGFLSSVLDLLPSPKYTVIYTTTPISSDHPQILIQESQTYEMDSAFPSAVHIDLKRDYSIQGRASNHSGVDSSLPLFEKYQFFTPGIFMGLLVGFLLLAILYVGISGVSSLQVSYAAFDKENGPAAQKKQQQ